ncbi:hypothetical protein EDI_082020 [Entamoeba dispar SAW760]|uniref:Uncharacterized protein n=1 Tax=Entamoeba dispar (strain ATCC PRA-260 / SAW760) TaxID=370354 RepID=B0ELL8_ENTDS|nr:uncharacterized protein EDI_082020 [Entamoeba dispar SAW760]EDR24577.1 hypothetical protein EDI_082020 [Entamoeba dispar SAW760]|eukprot:EDR24577.1 hypothetical protein EDI_082020 [Entamoeba dispar SAW760]
MTRFGVLKRNKKRVKNIGKKIAGIGGKVYKWIGNAMYKVSPVAKPILGMLPGGSIITGLYDRGANNQYVRGQFLNDIADGKSAKEVITNYKDNLVDYVIKGNNPYDENNINSNQTINGIITQPLNNPSKNSSLHQKMLQESIIGNDSRTAKNLQSIIYSMPEGKTKHYYTTQINKFNK